jgi:hypothetical protein
LWGALFFIGDIKMIDNLLKDREKEYGATWYVVGQIMKLCGEYIYSSALFRDTPFAHNWVQILGKLIRALTSPNKRDNWQDIIGYATLVLDFIDSVEKAQENNEESS